MLKLVGTPADSDRWRATVPALFCCATFKGHRMSMNEVGKLQSGGRPDVYTRWPRK